VRKDDVIVNTAGRATALGALGTGGSLRGEAGGRKDDPRYRAVFEDVAVGLAILDPEGRVSESNPAMSEMLGYAESELRGMTLGQLAHPEDGGWEDDRRVERRLARKDGGFLWASVALSPLRGAGSAPPSSVVAVEDVTRRRLSEEKLRQSERGFRQLFENFTDAFFIHDENGRFVDCNVQACRALGYEKEDLLGLAVGDVTVRLLSEEERRARGEDRLWERVMRAEPGSFVGFDRNELRRRDGTTFPVEVAVGAIDYEGRRMIFAAARDISEREALESQLAHKAFHDPLTGLPNRALFMDRLEHALELRNRRPDSLAVLFLDLDDFKKVNDTLGHDVGDQVLVEVGRRLASCVRSADTVARLAGDEFTILLEHMGERKDAVSVANRIEEGLKEPFRLDDHEIVLSASIGVVPEAPAGLGPRDLLKAADDAMYEAKRKGKNRYEVYEPPPAGAG
jgi:diguanylate cyclase (GGDEF)-like protein/PAS domain S-box-containing protein